MTVDTIFTYSERNKKELLRVLIDQLFDCLVWNSFDQPADRITDDIQKYASFKAAQGYTWYEYIEKSIDQPVDAIDAKGIIGDLKDRLFKRQR